MYKEKGVYIYTIYMLVLLMSWGKFQISMNEIWSIGTYFKDK